MCIQLKTIFGVLFIMLSLIAGTVHAEKYGVVVKKVGNNMYKDKNSGALIKTSLCLELAIGDEAILIWDCPLNSERYACGKLIFIDSGETCQVDAVYD